MANQYQSLDMSRGETSKTGRPETPLKKAYLVTFIFFMLVGIAAMIMGMYYAPTYLESIAAIFDVLRYGRKSAYYKESCQKDKSAPVCAIVDVSESIVGIVDNVEAVSSDAAQTSSALSSDATQSSSAVSGSIADLFS